jgi:hypothetical protein
LPFDRAFSSKNILYFRPILPDDLISKEILMHYLPVLVFVVILKMSLLWAFGGPRRVWAFAKDFVTIGEDHWTYMTTSGEWFEDAEIEAVQHGEVVLKHRHGVVRLAFETLSEQSRRLVIQTEKWADYAESVPVADKVTPFTLEPFAIEAA